jgi:hypothetical protein
VLCIKIGNRITWSSTKNAETGTQEQGTINMHGDEQPGMIDVHENAKTGEWRSSVWWKASGGIGSNQCMREEPGASGHCIGRRDLNAVHARRGRVLAGAAWCAEV